MWPRLITVLFLHILPICAYTQDQDTQPSSVKHFSEGLLANLSSKSKRSAKLISRDAEKFLSRLSKHEKRLYKKIKKIDAPSNFSSSYSSAIYQSLQNPDKVIGKFNSKYNGHLDSIKTALNFLNFVEKEGQTAFNPAELKNAIRDINSLQDKLNKSENIKSIIGQRKKELHEQLKQFGQFKELKKWEKEFTYYKLRVAEYDGLLSNPSKLESKFIEIISKSDAFKSFFSKYSDLAGLFRLSGNQEATNTSSITGLQTRSLINQEMQQRLGANSNPDQIVQEGVQSAQSELNNLKNKLKNTSLGNSSSEDMPDFKPNNQKTKTFFKRLEYGFNAQSEKSNTLFPVTTSLGLSVGYKLTDNKVIGIGVAYRLGLGKDINHISITHEGVGFRTFADFRIKNTFWLSGGGENNYRARFANIAMIKRSQAWQQSALLGIKKLVKARKFKGSFYLLYDFLYKNQVPASSPLLFRAGYSF